MLGYIDGIDFKELEAMKYFAPPASWSEEKRTTNAKDKIFSGAWCGAEKKDGFFAKIVKDEDGNTMVFSRSRGVDGQFANKVEWLPHLKSFFDELPNGTCFLGELYLPSKPGSRNVQTIMGCLKEKAIARQDKGEKINLYIFDCLAWEGKSWLKRPAGERFDELNGFERAYESKKSVRKSLKESKSISDICNSWIIGDAVGKFKNRDYCHKGNDYSVFNIGNIIENALRDDYILEFDGDNKAKSVIFYMVDKDGKNVGSLEIYPDERYEISNYEDGYDLSKLDMDEIADLFYEFQNNKIEYLLSDKRFDFTDKFWYNESKKFALKSIKESVKPEIQRMVNKIIDDLIGEYSNKEWDRLSDDEKFDIIENKYDFYYEFYFNKKNPKDLLEIKDLVIENMNHPFNVVFESKKSIKESSNKKVSDFENTNTKFIAIMDIEDFYDEDGNTSVLWQGKSSDIKKSDFYDFTVLETETYDKVLYLFVDIAEF